MERQIYTTAEERRLDHWRQWLQHPERSRVREFAFQVHFWVGATSRPICVVDEPFRRCHRFPQRGVGYVLAGVARKIAQPAFGRRYRPNHEWYRSNLRDAVMSNRDGYLVARNQTLETQLNGELARAFPTKQLGSAQCPRVLVPSVCFAMGHLGYLSIASSIIQRSISHRSR